MPEQEKGKELVLNGWQYATVLDTTKGNIWVLVGPFKAPLESTDQPVRWDGKKFANCSPTDSIRDFVQVNEGSYVVLENPAKDEKNLHPPKEKTQCADLHFGRTVNLPGPMRFSLWPGQTATVIPGHELRSNQYLVVKITNGDLATANRGKLVLKPQAQVPSTTLSPIEAESTASDPGGDNTNPSAPSVTTPIDDSLASDKVTWVTGQHIIVSGTKFSFFMPTDGMEVVQERGNQYVREAVTLESLQYCVLLSEDGKKRYVPGPAVVFPEPNEVFVTDGSGERKFKAIELNPQMGIHVKVISDYSDESRNYRAGEEIFITGRAQQIYCPRPEHAIIPYRGDERVHFAVVVPEGDGRYVLDKESGGVNTVMGPKMLLANPVKEVMVRRVLAMEQVALWYPNNAAAEQHNATLRRLEANAREAGSDYLAEGTIDEVYESSDRALSFRSDEISRRSGFTPPKTITLKGKYDGAVTIDVWPGYAIQRVSKTGKREVVTGPTTVVLGYNETLGVLELSSGKPKGTQPKKSTVYLRVVGNRVSDVVDAETKDRVKVRISVSYRVNFTGEQNGWFSLQDYVGFMTDHLRSVIRGAVKRVGIEEFDNNSVAIVRDSVLGVTKDGAGRPGKLFDENGMKVYDLEVLAVGIGDVGIDKMLADAQKESVFAALQLEARRRQLKVTVESEELTRKGIESVALTDLARVRSETELKRVKLESESQLALSKFQDALQESEGRQKAEVALAGIPLSVEKARLEASRANQELISEVSEAELARNKMLHAQEVAFKEVVQRLQIELLGAQTAANVARFQAMTPGLIDAMQSLADTGRMVEVARAIKTIPMGIGEGMNAVISRIFQDTVVAGSLNGHDKQLPISVSPTT